jgi:hypothetical protein
MNLVRAGWYATFIDLPNITRAVRVWAGDPVVAQTNWHDGRDYDP